MAYWKPLPVKDLPLSRFVGLHETIPHTERPFGVASVLSNLVLDPAPSLATRPGLTAQGSALAAAVSRGIFQYRNLAGSTVQTLAQAGQQLSYWNGTTWTSITAAATNGDFTAANLNGYGCIFYSGAAAQRWDGAALVGLGGTPPQGAYVVAACGKLFVGGIPTREGDIDFSDDENPEVWTPAATNTAGSIYISADPIKWVGFTKTFGKVVVWTSKETHVLYGPETPDNPSLWEPKVETPYGTPNGKTVQNLNGTWVWLTDSGDRKGFVFWSGGVAEVVEKPIETSLGLINWASIANACSWLDSKGRYHCQTPKSSGYQEFIYDPHTRQWSMGSSKDIRQSGPITISGQDYTLVGSEVGQQYRVTGTDDAGTAISWDVVLGPTALGDAFVNKQLIQVEVVFSAATGATVNGAVALNESGSYGTTKVVTTATTIARQKFMVPVGSTDGNRSDIFRLRLWGSGVVTVHGVKLRFYQGQT